MGRRCTKSKTTLQIVSPGVLLKVKYLLASYASAKICWSDLVRPHEEEDMVGNNNHRKTANDILNRSFEWTSPLARVTMENEGED